MDGISSLGFSANVSGVPVEVTENEKPLLFEYKELSRDSGGPGKFRGGLGHALAVQSTSSEAMTFAARMDRTTHPTVGIEGGSNGAPAFVAINGEIAHPKKTRELGKGDVFSVQCAGGAGYGSPLERNRAKVQDDIADGYISIDAAKQVYGW